MARPQKSGLDYFPLDVDMDQDDKIALIEAQHGITGFAIVIKLLMKIYKNSYFYEWTEKEQLLFSKRVNVDINEVNVVINDCVKWGLFNGDLLENHKILTSKGIQRRYLEAVARRQKVKMSEEYLLLDNETVNAYKNLVIVNINGVNADINPQSKVKKSKVKKSKENENNKTHSYALELCNYFSELMPGQSIAQHIGALKIWIDMYGYEWTKEAIQKCVSSKNKFVKPWIKTVLENWKSEGKEYNGGSTRQDIKKGEGKWDGFKPPKPKITEDIDTTDLI
ncbi:DUF4373 domain-containing protein [Clostridium haemolyticum]|uniref:Damage-indicible protein DnaD n=1 Tax=Clostridium haemolyticum NCTC 9693 TaxID=1443114 RepID=A0ABR4TCY1_CLOHA|nr:DUF4373 domain-containing protein [Clostridium haemolyticum]KEI15790.1 damage-indicible protein DnaD [Clostridium haemolyticum NCTC 9693]